MTIRFSRSVPFLACVDVEKTMQFYIDKLGFTKDWTWNGDDGEITDGGVVRDDLSIYFMKNAELAARVHESELMMDVSPIEAIHAEHVTRGAPITRPLRDEPWGVREYSIVDPAGYRLRFGESLADIQPRNGPKHIEKES